MEPLTQEALEAVDVLLDFSSESGLMEAAHLCRETRTALVSGSTPLGPAALRLLDELASDVAVLHAANFSRGLAALLSILPGLRDRLGPRFDAGVIDVHHRHKKDAPSGTARTLEAAWSQSTGRSVPVSSLRIGEAIGDHALWIDGGRERIEIWHRAFDRGVFAEGALDAAFWIAGQKPGRYGVAELWSST
ncbi:dihydrodipicolinate reductase [mine drainage metagenome]|uniref:4-hydroxy-tetrahydrodipicolinate reductase n=2 Tax=mine drainage metagenome TaxID=410659 RepID=T1A772_9ZZZZ